MKPTRLFTPSPDNNNCKKRNNKQLRQIQCPQEHLRAKGAFFRVPVIPESGDFNSYHWTCPGGRGRFLLVPAGYLYGQFGYTSASNWHGR